MTKTKSTKVSAHEDGEKQTCAAVVRDGRHTVRQRFGAHRRLRKLVRLIYRASRLITERMVTPKQRVGTGEIAVFVRHDRVKCYSLVNHNNILFLKTFFSFIKSC
uniref:Uncharacterized protein n=1 Tax=Sipha flava TaxID=143950 RepID=A0A2S2R5F1_9HEMI